MPKRNGKNIEKTLKNVKRFNEIREKEYTNSRLTTRISGVKVNDIKNVDEMIDKLRQGITAYSKLK